MPARLLLISCAFLISRRAPPGGFAALSAFSLPDFSDYARQQAAAYTRCRRHFARPRFHAAISLARVADCWRAFWQVLSR